jgi:hypothetical protein
MRQTVSSSPRFSKQSLTKRNGETEMTTKTLILFNHAGIEFDRFELNDSKNLPEVIIWGIGSAQRAFRLESGNTYREASWIWWTGPDPTPALGISSGLDYPVGLRG